MTGRYLDRMLRPLEGHVMPPEASWTSRAASIICGHDLVQAQSCERQAEFEQFVRDVLITERK